MEEHTFNSPVDTHLPAEQPHFDDERTLLTARPVVPLAKIDAKERNLKRWVLGGAFALAMVLGAGSALIASYLKLRNVPSTATEASAEADAPVAPLAVAPEVNTSEFPVVENTEEAEPLEEPVTPKRAPVVRRRAERDTDLVRPRVVRDTNEEDELQRIRESVLIDAWEERRARRAARRERRNRVDHHDRDLSNLDEIFEGPRRRRRSPS